MRFAIILSIFISGYLATSAFSAALEVRIDISQQKIFVYQNGFLRHRWKVSTARRGYITPRGSYRPTRMYTEYYSKKYDNSPMPHSIFFNGGYAIHGTNYVRSLGQPASHGCVRLHPENAATLYNLVNDAGRENTRITVTN